MKFQDDISNMNTHKRTHTHTNKPKPICPPLFQSWGHKKEILNKSPLRRTDMYWRENGLKYAEFGYPVTKFISSATQSSRNRHVEPGS